MYFPRKKYDIIYADPPWSYRRKTGQGVIKDYESMSDVDVYNLPVGSLANKDCALICWLTYPKIEEGITAIRRWGFEIKTVFCTWIKLNKKSGTPFFGVGAYTKSNAEFCLLATRGRVAPWVQNNSLSSIVMCPSLGHSAKPDLVRNMIVDLFGNRSRIELFARTEHKGWDSWGDVVLFSASNFQIIGDIGLRKKTRKFLLNP